MKNIKENLLTFGLSILVFFSLSFLQAAYYLHNFHLFNEVKLGIPYTYFRMFMVDCPVPNSGGNVEHLIIDFSLCYILVYAIQAFIKACSK